MVRMETALIITIIIITMGFKSSFWKSGQFLLLMFPNVFGSLLNCKVIGLVHYLQAAHTLWLSELCFRDAIRAATVWRVKFPSVSFSLLGWFLALFVFLCRSWHEIPYYCETMKHDVLQLYTFQYLKPFPILLQCADTRDSFLKLHQNHIPVLL